MKVILLELKIQNVLLIENQIIDFTQGFNVITGETGAGKTLLTKCLELILGKKVDSSIIRPQSNEAYVEAKFKLDKNYLQDIKDLEAYVDLETNEINIARRITKNKNYCFIDGKTVNLSLLKQVSNYLIEFQTQEEKENLKNLKYQTLLFDSFKPNNQKQLANYQSIRKEWQKIKNRLNDLNELFEKQLERKDFIEFQVNELNESNLQDNEEPELMDRLKEIENSQSQNELYNNLNNLLSSQELQYPLEQAINLAYQIKDDSLVNSLNNALQEINESALFTNKQLSLEFSSEELESINYRLELIHNLMRKHRINYYPDLLENYNKLQEELENLNSIPEQINKLEIELKIKEQELEKLSQELSAIRNKKIKIFNKTLTAHLKTLSLEHSVFEAKTIEYNEKYGELGNEYIEFYYQPSKEYEQKPLITVASGGEKSRILLALNIEASLNNNILILDEPDNGIGGKVALNVGSKIKEIASNRQVIVISHLPQVAGLADNHLVISKEHTNNKIYTEINQLNNEDQKLSELVRMQGLDETKENLEIARKYLETS